MTSRERQIRPAALLAVLLVLPALAAAQAQQVPSLPPVPPGPGGGLSPFATLPPPPASSGLLGRLTAVTDAMLANPASGDWLTWRRTYDDIGFSPLKEIDHANASTLRVAWTWSLPPGASESTPLVHDGVLFVFGYGDRVQAIDAATGDLL